MLPKKKSEKFQTDDFRKSFGLSLALHSFILALFLVNMYFFSKPILDLSQAIDVNFSELAIPDKLPDKVQEPEPIAEPAAEPEKAAGPEPVKATPPKEEPAPKKTKPVKPKNEEIDLSKSASRQKKALAKLKKLSAIEKIKADVRKENVVKAAQVRKAKRIVAAGSALTGLDKLEAGTYLAQLDQIIKQHWTLPQWLMNKPLKAQILIKFNATGNILATQLLSSSGNNNYDEYCLQAVQKAAPFPSVPAKLTQKFSVDGIIIGFPE